MTLKRAIAVVFGFTAFGAGAGLAAGYFLATAFPGYYGTLFARPDGSEVDTVSIGVGLGLTQGMSFGAVIGVATVFVLCWFNLRKDALRLLALQHSQSAETGPLASVKHE